MRKNKNNESINLGKNIYLRKDGRYIGRLMVNGKRIQKTSKDIRVVEDWLKEQQDLITLERVVDSLEKRNIGVKTQINTRSEKECGVLTPNSSIDELFITWIDYKKIHERWRDNTVRNNTERYQINIQPTIGGKRICDITERTARSVFDIMLAKKKKDGSPYYKESTIKNAYVCLGEMLKFAKEEGLIDEVPLKRIGLPERSTKEARYLTIEEQEKFLKAAEGTTCYFPLLFVLLTGLRCSEMIGAKWSDVDWNEEHPSIHIQRNLEYRHSTKKWKWGATKTASSNRTVYLTPEAVEVLRQVKENSNVNERTPAEFRDLIFLTRQGLPRKNSAYDTYLYKLCDKAGIEHFSIHKLRHTYATNALSNGARVEFVERQLGHKNITTTIDTYRHISDDESKQQIGKMSNFHKQLLSSEFVS